MCLHFFSPETRAFSEATKTTCWVRRASAQPINDHFRGPKVGRNTINSNTHSPFEVARLAKGSSRHKGKLVCFAPSPRNDQTIEHCAVSVGLFLYQGCDRFGHRLSPRPGRYLSLFLSFSLSLLVSWLVTRLELGPS